MSINWVGIIVYILKQFIKKGKPLLPSIYVYKLSSFEFIPLYIIYFIAIECLIRPFDP